MNLLAKRLGQLTMLSVALFFYSCEDENSIIGYPNPNKKFQVYTIEIPLESSVVGLDSIITDNKSFQAFVSLVGAYNDPLVGQVKTESYLQIFPAFGTPLPADAEYDSAVFQARLNYYTYGLTSTHTEKFNVHRIGEDLNRLSTHSYYYNNTIFYSPSPIGSGSIRLDFEDMEEQNELPDRERDTLLVRARLDTETAEQLLLRGKVFDLSGEAAERDEEIERFLLNFKGIALVPENSSTIFGFDLGENPSANFTRIYLYYHTPTDTAIASFVINPSSFTNITADRSDTELAGLLPYQETSPPSGKRFIQSGAAVTTKIDLSNFYAFLDTTENILINEAQLTINNVESPVGYAPHNSLRFRFLKDNNYFANARMSADAETFKNYHFVSDGPYYGVQADNPTQTSQFSVLSYEADENRFNGYMTIFAQNVNDNKNDDDGINDARLRYIALFPNAPIVSKAVTRTVFHKDDVKLRITYTRPTSSNLQ
jgi:hypothetical protein